LYVLRKDESDWAKRANDIIVEGSRPQGKQREVEKVVLGLARLTLAFAGKTASNYLWL